MNRVFSLVGWAGSVLRLAWKSGGVTQLGNTYQEHLLLLVVLGHQYIDVSESPCENTLSAKKGREKNKQQCEYVELTS